MGVIGAGWAGCAAAVELTRAGHHVTLFEASRTLGGRARRLTLGNGTLLDNGQHILLGAYSATLRMMKLVGIDRRQVLRTLPLQMRYPPQSGGIDFIAGKWPAPLHLLAAVLRSTGLSGADKMALARFSSSARWMDWQLHHDCSVSQLLERFDQTARLIQLLWRPLCLAALNTPPERASANTFLAVLRDSLGATRSASDMLLPSVDLSALFPDHAARFIEAQGGAVQLGATVTGVRPRGANRWHIHSRGVQGESDAEFDAVILATPWMQTATILKDMAAPETAALTAQLDAFEAEAITTCYLQYEAGVRLAQPFFALIDDANAEAWGQFVFDRGQLNAASAGLLAVVVSASGAAAELAQPALAAAIATQLSHALQRPELALPRWSQVITDKRATFACAPGLLRPANATGLPGLTLAGDYTASAYPATIESAVRSGVLAAACVLPA